jgi:hypothetical protein
LLSGKQRLDLAHAILLDGEPNGSGFDAVDQDYFDDQPASDGHQAAFASEEKVPVSSPITGGRARAALRKAVAVTRMQSKRSVDASSADDNVPNNVEE